MTGYRQDDRNIGYCPKCGQELSGLTVDARGYCEQHGWQWAEWSPLIIEPWEEWRKALDGDQFVS